VHLFLQYFMLLVIFIPHADANLKSWMVYSSNGSPPEIEEGRLPVEGKSVASIKPVLKSFKGKLSLGAFDKSYFGYLDFYYFAQTVDCRNFRGKHFQISHYAKLDQSGVKAHYETYKKLRIDRIIAHYRKNNLELDVSQLKSNAKTWTADNLLNNSELDLYVFISTGDSIKIQSGNNNFSLISPEWQRLNIEVDVPTNCDALTIAFKFRGAGTVYLDAFSVVERGNISPQHNYNSQFRSRAKKLGEMIELWISKSRNQFEFENMGFEAKNQNVRAD